MPSSNFEQRSPRRMEFAVIAIALCLAVSAHIGRAANPSDLDAKEVFTLGLPQGLAFRGEMSRPLHRDYAAWSGALREQTGVIRKFMTEELPKIYPQSVGWADRFALEHP